MDPNSNKCSLTKEQHLEYKPMTSIATLMESFRRTYSLGDNCELNYYGDIKNCSNLAELLIKDEKNRVVNNNTDPKTNGVGWCFSYNKNNKCNFCRTRDITQNIVNCNYLPDIICEHCKDKLRKLKSDPATQIKVKNTYKLRGTKSLYSTHPPMPPISIRDEINTKATNGERIADANISPELGFGSVVQFEDDELKLYWLEVRNSIFQIFHEEGITLNSVTRKYLNPPIFNSFVLQSTDMLKDCVHKLFTSNRRKLFTLCVFQLQLFIIEIKLRLHIELMENKPIDGFLGCVEDEYLKPNKLKWFNFHLLFFQTFVYMNRFIQQSISLLCDCTDDNDFKTYNDEDSKMTGSYFPPNRNCEMRERLRKRLNKKKKQTNIPELESAEEDEKKSNIKDERNLDDLLQFINGDNGENEQLNDNKKKKKTRKRHPKNSAAATPTNDEKSPLKESKSPTNDNNKSSKKRKNKKMKHKDRNFPVVSITKKKSNENVLNHEMIDVDQCSESIDANDEDDGEVDEVNHLVNQFDLADNSQESDCDNVIFEESKSFNIAENEDDDEFEYEEDYYNDDVELVEYSDEDVEEPVEYDNIYSKHKDQILEWPNDSLMVIDDVFKPKDIDLENEDMDEFERQLELFKRLCYDPFSTNKSVKPKLIIDVNEVFKRI
ncbi:hypothetical protein RDWZM_001243 [Blomia tropicalis]|uniref:FAM193 C-terminal domain-containing protein n=1 Tax=Blomia tropicalis TaxID=40697 RepID=A0A9Q0RNS0_BLOTA|nr:hypothetical protein RDWZM_001243 [Blomia tropicalis]